MKRTTNPCIQLTLPPQPDNNVLTWPPGKTHTAVPNPVNSV